MDNQLQPFDEVAIRHNAAMAAARTIYEAQHQRPTLVRVDRSDWYIALGVTIIVIASVIVSGSRTVVEFGGGLIGVSAFVMLECAVVAYAFIRTKNNINTERIQDVRKLTNRGLKLAFIVAVAANIHATLKQYGVISAEWINIIILLLVGISAPTLAFISGDIAGLEYMRAVQKHRQNDEENARRMDAWNDGFNQYWARQQSKWGVRIEVEREPVPQISSNLIKNNQNSSRHKPSPRLQKALDYLNEHPEDLEKPSRELEVKIPGISYGTINKAQVMIRNGSSPNGVSE